MGKTRAGAVALAWLVVMTTGSLLAWRSAPAPEIETAVQAFNSGSTGADGALDLATQCSSPFTGDQNSCYVQLPPNGVLNYTTVNIPAGRTLKFRANLQNTPVYLLAQGDVVVAGTISVAAGGFLPPNLGNLDPSAPGPGGFRGGSHSQPGFGPGAGGSTDATKHARWVGPLSLVPIIGGSGGGGSCGGGGGGGGAIVVASSTAIRLSGGLYAHGTTHNHSSCGAGSGGAVRLLSNSIVMSGTIYAYAGNGAGEGQGVIRLEAPLAAMTMSGSTNPAAVIASINPAIFASAIPALTIVSVGGYPVPTYAGQRFDTVDLLLPMQLPDPINVVVAATNIPVGTQIQMSFGTGNTGTVTPGTLAGSNVSSQGTVRVSGLNRTQLAYLFVHATFPVATGADVGNPPGPDQVARVQASAPPGGATQFTFFRQNGTRVPESAVPAQVLKQFRQ